MTRPRGWFTPKSVHIAHTYSQGGASRERAESKHHVGRHGQRLGPSVAMFVPNITADQIPRWMADNDHRGRIMELRAAGSWSYASCAVVGAHRPRSPCNTVPVSADGASPSWLDIGLGERSSAGSRLSPRRLAPCTRLMYNH